MSLQTLRADPINACWRNVYRTGPAKKSFTAAGAFVEGGRCSIGSNGVNESIFDLQATVSNYASSDYFYPWLRQGVGWVQVPKNVQDGTIVMTGGVNGCTLVVTEFLNSYFFYHDGDSKYLYPGLMTGREVARVAPKDYDPLDWSSKKFANALADASAKGIQPVGDVSYGHFVVAVKSNGRFGFYVTGAMSLNGITKLPVATSPCIVTWD